MMRQTSIADILWIALCVVNLRSVWARTVLPAQLGPHPVSIKDYTLHTDRHDPWAPTPQLRKLMLTVYKPDLSSEHCSKPSIIEYMPPKVAPVFDQYLAKHVPNGTMERVRLRSCEVSESRSRWWKQTPLLLFSPGLGYTRLMYAAMLTAVASSGYTVVSMDHTYAAAAVEFPNGQVAIGNQETQITDENEIAFLIGMMPVQVADVESVLKAIEVGKLPGLASYNKDLKVGIFGHSLGGATAAAAMVNDTRLVGGLNYDGSFIPPSTEEGFDRPFLMMGEEFHIYRDEGSEDASWDALWPNLRGWKSEIGVNNTRHSTFSDMPLIEKTLGIRQTRNVTEYEKFLGPIDGERAFKLIWKYTVTYFNFVLKGGDPSLLEANSTQYPEAIYLRGIST